MDTNARAALGLGAAFAPLAGTPADRIAERAVIDLLAAGGRTHIAPGSQMQKTTLDEAAR